MATYHPCRAVLGELPKHPRWPPRSRSHLYPVYGSKVMYGTARYAVRLMPRVRVWDQQARRLGRPSPRERKTILCTLSRSSPLKYKLVMELTAERKRIFLEELALHGIVARAARRASPGSETGAITTFREARASDEAFSAAWEDAMEVARAAVEYELHRRSVEGWEEPVYGGRYREDVVGTVRRYSDRLLEVRVRGLLPGYRDGGAAVQLNNYLNGAGAAEMRAKFSAALGQLCLADLQEFEGLMVRAIQLLGGTPPMGLESYEDPPQAALIEFGLGSALQHQGQQT